MTPHVRSTNPYINQPFVSTETPGSVGARRDSINSSTASKPSEAAEGSSDWLADNGPELCDFMQKRGAAFARDVGPSDRVGKEARLVIEEYSIPIPPGAKEYAIECFVQGYIETMQARVDDVQESGMTVGGLLLAGGLLTFGGLFVYSLVRG